MPPMMPATIDRRAVARFRSSSKSAYAPPIATTCSTVSGCPARIISDNEMASSIAERTPGSRTTRRRGEDVARENERVEQRPLRVLQRPLHRFAPGNHLRHEVDLNPVVQLADAVLPAHPQQRLGDVRKIDRSIHPIGHERVAGEAE